MRSLKRGTGATAPVQNGTRDFAGARVCTFASPTAGAKRGRKAPLFLWYLPSCCNSVASSSPMFGFSSPCVPPCANSGGRARPPMGRLESKLPIAFGPPPFRLRPVCIRRGLRYFIAAFRENRRQSLENPQPIAWHSALAIREVTRTPRAHEPVRALLRAGTISIDEPRRSQAARKWRADGPLQVAGCLTVGCSMMNPFSPIWRPAGSAGRQMGSEHSRRLPGEPLEATGRASGNRSEAACRGGRARDDVAGVHEGVGWRRIARNPEHGAKSLP
jgi:hypothetical protein